MMKTALWTLLLMGLVVPGRSSCQSDCILCDQDQDFDTVGCLDECDLGSLALQSKLCQVPIVKENSRRRKSAEEKMEAGSFWKFLLKTFKKGLRE